jgi:hypothetical protein
MKLLDAAPIPMGAESSERAIHAPFPRGCLRFRSSEVQGIFGILLTLSGLSLEEWADASRCFGAPQSPAASGNAFFLEKYCLAWMCRARPEMARFHHQCSGVGGDWLNSSVVVVLSTPRDRGAQGQRAGPSYPGAADLGRFPYVRARWARGGVQRPAAWHAASTLGS